MQNLNVTLALTEDDLEVICSAILNRSTDHLLAAVNLIDTDEEYDADRVDTLLRIAKSEADLYDRLSAQRRPMAERVSRVAISVETR